MPVALVGVQARGFLLGADGEAAAFALTKELFVEFAVSLLEARGVEALRENGGPADDVLSSAQLFGVAFKHLLLDAVAEGFDFGFRLFHESFPLLKGFDFGGDLVSAHFCYLLLF